MPRDPPVVQVRGRQLLTPSQQIGHLHLEKCALVEKKFTITCPTKIEINRHYLHTYVSVHYVLMLSIVPSLSSMRDLTLV